MSDNPTECAYCGHPTKAHQGEEGCWYWDFDAKDYCPCPEFVTP